MEWVIILQWVSAGSGVVVFSAGWGWWFSNQFTRTRESATDAVNNLRAYYLEEHRKLGERVAYLEAKINGKPHD